MTVVKSEIIIAENYKNKRNCGYYPVYCHTALQALVGFFAVVFFPHTNAAPSSVILLLVFPVTAESKIIFQYYRCCNSVNNRFSLLSTLVYLVHHIVGGYGC